MFAFLRDHIDPASGAFYSSWASWYLIARNSFSQRTEMVFSLCSSHFPAGEHPKVGLDDVRGLFRPKQFWFQVLLHAQAIQLLHYWKSRYRGRAPAHKGFTNHHPHPGMTGDCIRWLSHELGWEWRCQPLFWQSWVKLAGSCRPIHGEENGPLKAAGRALALTLPPSALLIVMLETQQPLSPCSQSLGARLLLPPSGQCRLFFHVGF